mgnify:CR=1 FL=1
MKMKKLLAFATALTGAMMFASCNVSDDTRDATTLAVRFTGEIGGQSSVTAETRAAGTSWSSGDAIGVFMAAHGSATAAEGAANKKYTTVGNGTFVQAGGDIYYPVQGAVDFMAYYPYAESATLGNIDVAIGNQNNQKDFDLLCAKADKNGQGYTKADATAPVALAFEHKLAKIVLNCKIGEGIGSLDGMTVKIKGMNSRNTFNLASGVLGTADTPADIETRRITAAQGYGASYDAIVMPFSYNGNAVSVEFTVDGDTFVWTIDKAEDAKFEAGNEYTYDVTVTRHKVSISATIKPWVTNDRGPVTAQ